MATDPNAPATNAFLDEARLYYENMPEYTRRPLDLLVSPTVNVPRIEEPGAKAVSAATGLPEWTAGVANAAGTFIEGMTSPLNVGLAFATGGASAYPKIARAAAGIFGADVAFNAAKDTPRALEVLSNPDASSMQKVEEVVQKGLEATFVTSLGIMAAKGAPGAKATVAPADATVASVAPYAIPKDRVLYQGVRSGNLDYASGKSKWLTDDIEVAKHYANIEGPGGRIDVYSLDDFPRGINKADMADPQLGGAFNFTGIDAIKPRQSLDAFGKPRAASEPAIIAPDGEQVRSLPKRAVEGEATPAPVKEAVAASPDSTYKPQVMDDLEAQVGRMSESDLALDITNTKSNTAVASAAELYGRKLAAGDTEGASRILLDAGKLGTTLGQLVNQYKMFQFATPEGVVNMVDTTLKKGGYDALSDGQKARLRNLSETSIKADAEMKAAKRAYVENPSPETWGRAAKAIDASESAARPLNEYASKFSPKTYGDILTTSMQGSLMAPVSLAFNVFANVTGYPLRASARTAAALTDAMETAISKRPRSVVASPIAGTVAKYKAMGEGMKEAGRIMKEGATGTDVAKGEIRSPHNAPQALRNAWKTLVGAAEADVPTKGGKVPLADVGKFWLEGTVGMPAEVFLRGVTAGDAPFRAAERARVINEFGKLRGLTPEQVARANKAPELFFNKKDMEAIDFEAARSVYQQSNSVGQFVNAGLDRLRSASPLMHYLARGIIPYTRTPINVLSELLTYTPAGLAKLQADIRNGNKREAHLTSAKVVAGSTVIGLGYYLYQRGVVTPSYNAYKGKELDAAYATIPPGSINASAMKRWAAGDDKWYEMQKDDTWMDATKFGLTGGLLMIGVDTTRSAEEQGRPQPAMEDIIAQSTLGGLSYTFNQSFMRGASGLMDALAKNQPDKWLSSYLETMSAPVAPNTLNAVGRYMRDYKPEFKDDSAWKSLTNKVKAKYQQDAGNLPLKRDIWGRKVPEVPQGANKFANIFFDVTKSRGVLQDTTDATLYRLWRETNDDGVWPSIPGKNLTVGDTSFVLNPVQHEKLMRDVGFVRRKMVERLIGTPQFVNLPAKAKIDVLKDVYAKAAEAGKASFMLKAVRAGQRFAEKPGPVSALRQE